MPQVESQGRRRTAQQTASISRSQTAPSHSSITRQGCRRRLLVEQQECQKDSRTKDAQQGCESFDQVSSQEAMHCKQEEARATRRALENGMPWTGKHQSLMSETRPRRHLKHPPSSSNLKGNRPRLSLRKPKMIMESQLLLELRSPPASKTARLPSRLFAHSADEDGEHFLEAIETLQKELEVELTTASRAKANDATLSFQAVDRMFLHSSNAEWTDAVGRHDKKNPNSAAKSCEKFKTCESDFAARAVFKPDACDSQKRFLQEHVKPCDLSTKEWSF